MFEIISKILLKRFGTRAKRVGKAYVEAARPAEQFEEQTKKLDDDALKAKTAEFKAAIKTGPSPRISCLKPLQLFAKRQGEMSRCVTLTYSLPVAESFTRVKSPKWLPVKVKLW